MITRCRKLCCRRQGLNERCDKQGQVSTENAAFWNIMVKLDAPEEPIEMLEIQIELINKIEWEKYVPSQMHRHYLNCNFLQKTVKIQALRQRKGSACSIVRQELS